MPPTFYGLALAPVAAETITGFILLTLATGYFGWWFTFLNICGEQEVIYLYRPNPYVDMYSDPGSRHWLVPAAQPAEVPAVQVAAPVS